MVTKSRLENITKCYSHHLTSFAILLDPSSDEALSASHEFILTYISYVGCGVSMFGLTFTLISYSLFRCLNREKSGKILMNLCGSMLVMNAIFILGSETTLTISGNKLCKAVAILLHYFVLCSLSWMLVEAVNMYQALVLVFTKYSTLFMLKRCLFAWGVPALIVIVTVAVDVNNYQTSTHFCFLSQGNPLAFYIALLSPASLIILTNLVVFIMISRVIIRPRFKGHVGCNTETITPVQLRGAFSVMTLLGVTWVFGPFAINQAKVVISYMFTIMNSLQGFLIFVFRCCFNPEVRMSWILLFKTGKLKRRQGHFTAYTYDNSTKSEDKINGRNSDTLKSNIYIDPRKKSQLSNDKNLETMNKNALYKASQHLDSNFDGNNAYQDNTKVGKSSHTNIRDIYHINDNCTYNEQKSHKVGLHANDNPTYDEHKSQKDRLQASYSCIHDVHNIHMDCMQANENKCTQLTKGTLCS